MGGIVSSNYVETVRKGSNNHKEENQEPLHIKDNLHNNSYDTCSTHKQSSKVKYLQPHNAYCHC